MTVWVQASGNVCVVAEHSVVHAATMPQPQGGAPIAVCGVSARLLAFPVAGKPGDRMTVSWPPYVSDVRAWGWKRCRECMRQAPGKPIRPNYATGAVR
jgi:hypothetical protein